jgi:hypothetical protein
MELPRNSDNIGGLNRLSHIGKKASDQAKSKMSASQKNRYINRDHPSKGRKQSIEEKKKRSEIIKEWWAIRKLKNINK